MAMFLSVCAAITVVSGAIYGVIRLADRLGITRKVARAWKAHRPRKRAPARTYSLSEIAYPEERPHSIGPAEQPPPYPDAVATSEYAEQRLARYRRDGLRTRRAR
jgi:hypothetical protein